MAGAILRSTLKPWAASLSGRVEIATERTAQDVVEAAQDRVAVDTGLLQARIHHEKVADHNYEVIAGDAEAWYGHFLEFGTVHMEPQPFLIPAIELVRETSAPSNFREVL